MISAILCAVWRNCAGVMLYSRPASWPCFTTSSRRNDTLQTIAGQRLDLADSQRLCLQRRPFRIFDLRQLVRLAGYAARFQHAEQAAAAQVGVDHAWPRFPADWPTGQTARWRWESAALRRRQSRWSALRLPKPTTGRSGQTRWPAIFLSYVNYKGKSLFFVGSKL